MEMKNINLEQKKINIIENILKIDNSEIINELQFMLNHTSKQFTIEEYKNEILEAEDDIKNNRLISNEDLKVKLGL